MLLQFKTVYLFPPKNGQLTFRMHCCQSTDHCAIYHSSIGFKRVAIQLVVSEA